MSIAYDMMHIAHVNQMNLITCMYVELVYLPFSLEIYDFEKHESHEIWLPNSSRVSCKY